VRRQSAKTDGAFGKETGADIRAEAADRNLDKAAASARRSAGGSGA